MKRIFFISFILFLSTYLFAQKVTIKPGDYNNHKYFSLYQLKKTDGTTYKRETVFNITKKGNQYNIDIESIKDYVLDVPEYKTLNISLIIYTVLQETNIEFIVKEKTQLRISNIAELTNKCLELSIKWKESIPLSQEGWRNTISNVILEICKGIFHDIILFQNEYEIDKENELNTRLGLRIVYYTINLAQQRNKYLMDFIIDSRNKNEIYQSKGKLEINQKKLLVTKYSEEISGIKLDHTISYDLKQL
ncbi:MAG: hypothetical protein MJB14_18985 [Spirochaetes bacterium]|nr:hypothetical protein [Spirochaetota bacterium]